MDLLVNDLSIHQQFQDNAAFHKALSRLMVIRSTIRRHGQELYSNRGFQNADPIPGMPMQKAIAGLSKNQQRAVFSWLSHSGPFWDDDGIQEHSGDDYLEFNKKIVTCTAVGEAAFRCLNGMDCGLVSLSPSAWEYSTVKVIWRGKLKGSVKKPVVVNNWWDVETLKHDLKNTAPPVTSWNELRSAATSRFENLVFSEDCFSPLAGIPFARASSDRFTKLLEILNRLAGTFDASGGLTAEGHEIYQEHFTGDRSSFSDSSESEKNNFHHELTFNDPGNPGHSLLFPWHGKVSHLTLRLHFSWPIVANQPIYIVYAGPKITKQ